MHCVCAFVYITGVCVCISVGLLSVYDSSPYYFFSLFVSFLCEWVRGKKQNIFAPGQFIANSG